MSPVLRLLPLLVAAACAAPSGSGGGGEDPVTRAGPAADALAVPGARTGAAATGSGLRGEPLAATERSSPAPRARGGSDSEEAAPSAPVDPAGTDLAGPSAERRDGSDPTPAEGAVDEDDAQDEARDEARDDAHAPPTPDEWDDLVVAVVPDLPRIEALAEGGDPAAARARLLELCGDGVASLVRGVDDALAADAAGRLLLVARRLGLRDVALDAASVRRDHVVRLLDPDHDAVLEAHLHVLRRAYEAGRHDVALEAAQWIEERQRRLFAPSDERVLHACLNVGAFQMMGGDASAAAVTYRELLDAVAGRPADDPLVLTVEESLGMAECRLGEYGAGVERLERVREAVLRVTAPDDPARRRVLANLANVLGDSGARERALEVAREGYELAELTLPPDHPERVSAAIAFARALGDSGDAAGAAEVEEPLLAHLRGTRGPDDPDLLDLLLNLGSTRNELGDVDGALELLDEAVATSRASRPGSEELRAALTNAGNALMSASRFDEALARYEEALALAEERLPPEHPARLGAMQNVGSACMALGSYERAAELFDAVYAARAATLPPDHPWLLDAAFNLANVLPLRGQPERALALKEHVLSARLRDPSSSGAALSRSALGVAGDRMRCGDLAGARDAIDLARNEWFDALPEQHRYRFELDELEADVHLALGDLDRAQWLYADLLERAEAHLPPGSPAQLDALEGLDEVLWRRGRHDEASALTERRLAALVERLPPHHVDVLGARTARAMNAIAVDDGEAALRELSQILALVREHYPTDRLWVARVRHQVAKAQALSGRLDEALGTMGDVVETYRDAGASDDEQLGGWSSLCDLAGLAGDLEALRAAQLELLGLVERRARALQLDAPRVARAAALRLLGDLERAELANARLAAEGVEDVDAAFFEALETVRTASVAAPLLGRRLAAVPELARARADLAALRRRIADGSAAPPDDPAELSGWNDALVRDTQERDRLERHLLAALEERGVALPEVSVAALAAALGQGEALVTFLRHEVPTALGPTPEGLIPTETRYSAFALAGDGVLRRVELGRAGTVDDAITRWREALGRPLDARAPGLGIEVAGEGDGDRERASGEDLRALLLDPLFAVLPDARRLRVVPDDALFLVPFDALPLGEGVVGDRCEVRPAVSAVQWLGPAGGRRRTAEHVLLVGGVDYGEGEQFDLRPLPGTAEEVRAIAALRGDEGVERLVGEAATRDAVVARAPDATVVHLATHGWFDPRPAALPALDARGGDDALRSAARVRGHVVGFLPETLCGLALAGANGGPEGVLTAEELRALDLGACDLAVLSACETNVGVRRAGQGIQSLQTALHAAGARTAITSLWKVDDAATRRLFEVFYTKLWKEGLGPAEALWQAKVALRSDGHPPRDWAGWVLTGDPR